MSQSSGLHVEYPGGLRAVELTEVVRCTERILTAASAFQLGSERQSVEATSSLHAVPGEPLKTFLFDAAAEGGRSAMEAYAEQTAAYGSD